MRTAAYARYSSDQQSASSITDQLRNIRACCARFGWPEPVVYTDEAISGARTDRPGYQRLLADATRFDVILVDDLSRLSRDSIETAQAIKRLTFKGVRVIGVSDGVDTGRKGHTLEVGVRGIMSELYLADLADKTHRGLTGKAMAGASAGGLPYGYRVTSTGQREIYEAQAAIVRRIFAEYIAGQSPREIAAALNAERAPSPRASSWGASAIRGDTKRGIGILANPIYIGRQVWNRSKWVKHPDTGRRLRKERDPGEWVTTEHPELAIVDATTWEAAQARVGAMKINAVHKGGPGRTPRYLLSGIIRCGHCGGPMAKVDLYRYGCVAAKERGPAVCPGIHVACRPIEAALLATVRDQLSCDAAYARFQRAVTEALRQARPDESAAKARLAAAEKVHANILAALRAGIITPSTKAELVAAERELSEATAAAVPVQAHTMLPRARDVWKRMLDTLADRVRNMPAARAVLAEMLGDRAKVRNENGAILLEIAPSQIKLVAGAGYGLYLTEPLRIPITP